MNVMKNLMTMCALASAVCLVSCSNDDEMNVNNDGQVRFTAAIGNEAVVATPGTRASGITWGPNDNIGIFMVYHEMETIAERYSNRQFRTTTGKENFSPVMGQEIYYPMDNMKVDFISYYPYTDGAALDTSFPVTIETTQTDASQPGFDLMWAKATNSDQGYNKVLNATVAFTFGHCLSKLTMNCTLDASVGAANLDDAKVTIHSMNTVSTFNLKTGEQNGTPGTPADITPRKLAPPTEGFDATYDAIILPAGYGDGAVTVDFEINSEIYTWNVDAMTFEAGNEYIYEVEITRSSVKVTGTIVEWNPVTHQGPVYAE